jgi:ADP-L-glycero-D-manno-heptose 6-epimerase
MGACSATTEKDFDYLYTNNVEYSKKLWNYCADRQISFIYASSAATYGNGEQGFSDENCGKSLEPLNGYGYSKKIFDVWAAAQTKIPKQHVGLKFFNVYGPNEYSKGSMASVVHHGFNQLTESGKIRLFKSHNPDYKDGGQLRDFIYVKDICSVIRFFIENPTVNGLFNVGTGITESFSTLGKSIFKALKLSESIEYIDMPEHLREKYQYFTQAKIDKLRSVGYNNKFYTLEDGVADYIQNYLNKDYTIW